ncbi:MAG: AAA family ATPase [Deltaproteobacteria bacterium]|nr:AAA family ATPase [Deltaproteobacteria bacterium]
MALTGLARRLADSRVVLTCGTGGVGKTTTAAALALGEAARRRVLVLTIDPAKRLADALGVDLSRAEPVRVWSAESASGSAGGYLDALMLDVKGTFDRVIERYAPDAATARTILTNPLYKSLSAMITGSQEYMAMEKLYEVAGSGNYDLIVVDTPPAAHAVDFLQGPQRLVRALTDSMLQLFVRPSLAAGRIGAKLLNKGADWVMHLFGRLTGVEILQEMADLVMSTVSLFGGFSERAAAVKRLLREPTTCFCVVTTPQVTVIADTIDFFREVEAEGLQLGGAIVNRMLPVLPGCDAGDPEIYPQALRESLQAIMEWYTTQLSAERSCVEQLRKALPFETPVVTLPWQLTDLHRIDGLQELARLLFAGPLLDR